MEIVRPDRNWSQYLNPQELAQRGLPQTTRLAWICTFQVGIIPHDIFIDAETGELLGHEYFQPLGRQVEGSIKTASILPISQMLKTAQSVYLRGKDAKGIWTAKPFLKFNAKNQPHAIAMLTKTADFRQAGPAEAPSQQIVLVNRSHAIGVYSYFPKTGVLGSGSDWATVPSEFQKWLQLKIAAVGKPLVSKAK